MWGMKTLAENRKAKFEYSILETFKAGISLTGQEVKSIRAGRANLTGAYVIIKPDGAFILNMEIPPFQPKNAPADYNPSRTRKLLLRKDEIKYLLGKSQESGLTILPILLYVKDRYIKIEIALARRKKKQDKREILKKRQTEREISRTLKS
jgi:SsrA-binding protein